MTTAAINLDHPDARSQLAALAEGAVAAVSWLSKPRRRPENMQDVILPDGNISREFHPYVRTRMYGTYQRPVFIPFERKARIEARSRERAAAASVRKPDTTQLAIDALRMVKQ